MLKLAKLQEYNKINKSLSYLNSSSLSNPKAFFICSFTVVGTGFSLLELIFGVEQLPEFSRELILAILGVKFFFGTSKFWTVLGICCNWSPGFSMLRSESK